MIKVPTYSDYLQKIDECLHFRNNPDRATVVVQCLNNVLQRYNALTYNKEYFAAFFNDLYLHSRNNADSYNIQEIQNVANFFFDEAIQQQLASLSVILDRFSLILKKEREAIWSKRIGDFLVEIECSDFYDNTISRVEVIWNYEQKAKKILFDYRNS